MTSKLKLHMQRIILATNKDQNLILVWRELKNQQVTEI